LNHSLFSNIQAFLFDLDGTLVNSAPDLAAAVNATMAEIGKPTHPQALVEQWIGNGARKLIGRALVGDIEGTNDEGEVDRVYPIFMKHYEAHLCEKSYMYEGVLPALEALHAKGLKIACVTNKPEQFTWPLLKKLKIDQYFSSVVGGGTLPVLKPSPEPLFHACEEMNISKQDIAQTVCMVGDSSSDIKAAKSAGMISVAVSYGYVQGVDLMELGASMVVDSIEEILNLL
jgi:phosphoglycolate phosphatase